MSMEHLNWPQDNNATLLGACFSARVSKGPGGQIVVSYAGTDVSSKTAMVADFLSGATARDAAKTQIYIGQSEADTFTGGDKADTFLAGAGNDTLSGGNGHDLLYGGAGEIKVDGAPALTGGKKLSADLDIWESDNGFYRYSQMGCNLTLLERLAEAGFDHDASNAPNLGMNCLETNCFEENEASSLVFVADNAIVNIANEFSGACHLPAFARNTQADKRGCRRRRRRNGQLYFRRRSDVAMRSLGCKV